MRGNWLIAFVFVSAASGLSPLADIGPAPRTVLVDSAGKPFDLASLKGKVVLVSFVYTTCNGSCPATTSSLVRIQKTLEQAKLWGNSVEFVSITLDPKRDTPEVLKRYGQLFGADVPGWHFLTGSSLGGRVSHRRLGDVGQDRPCRCPRPSVADLSARPPGPPARDLQPRIPQGRFRTPRRAGANRRTSEEITPAASESYCRPPTAYPFLSKTA